MKKTLCLIIAVLMLILCGCSNSKNGSADDVFASYLERADSFENAVHEYGEEESRVLFGEKLVATVPYPKVSIEQLDNAIDKWTSDLVTKYQLEAAAEDFEGTAELTVTYNSYKSKLGTVSVEFMGIYSASYLAHPTDIVATFVADLETGEMLEIDDLLAAGKRAEIENKIAQEFEIDLDFVEGDLLEQWVISNNELKIVLPRGEFLPMSDGTKSLTFSKKETKAFLKGEETQQEEPDVTEETVPEVTQENGETEENIHIDPDKPVLALTFDDGPSAHTQRLLDIFEKYGGKATFFVVGNTLDNRKEVLKRIANQGHEIGNHSWSHRQFTNLSKEEVTDQIMMTRVKIFDITGVDCTIVRPPYGACNDTVKAIGKELDVAFVNWSVDTLDWKTKNADAVYNEIMEDAADGEIILCHDLHKTTVDAMEKAIPALLERGYQLVTVTELLTCRGEEIISGEMYYKQ